MSVSTNYFPTSQRELWDLIEERSAAGANTNDVDQQIWDTFGDEGAMMFTDLAGFTRRSAEFGVTHFLQTIFQSQMLLRPIVDEHSGVVFEVVGDSMLIWFKSLDQAIDCAVAMQRTCREFNKERKPHDQVLLCLGLGFGRVLRIGYTRLAGEELNVASKLGEDMSEGYEILVSQAVQEAAADRTDVEFILTGEQLPGCPEIYRLSY